MIDYTEVTSWDGQDGVWRIVRCDRCGAAIILNPRLKPEEQLAAHRQSHERLGEREAG